jgi:hypothetical protein
MRTTAYNDEAAAWSRNNHLMEPDPSPQVMTARNPWTEIKVNQNTPVPGTI